MRARTATIVGSAVFHVLLGAAAVYWAGQPKPHKPQSVAMMGEKKKPPKVDPPPPPPPRPKVASRAVEPVAEPAPVKETAPRPQAKAPVSAGTLSNAGGGGGTPSGGASGSGGTGGGGPGDGTSGAHSAVATKKPVAPGDECTEAPTKAQPVNRATEIEYTQQARQDGIEGRLVLKVVVGADGAVTDVIVVSSVDPALDAAAIAAVRTWVFRPASRCGKPMAGGTYTLAQRFELGD